MTTEQIPSQPVVSALLFVSDMASPQKENGYTAIANELLAAIVASNLSALELKVVLSIIRKTYGFQKKSDKISLSQLQKMVGCSRQGVVNVVKSLENKGIITIQRGNINKYSIQKDYSKWFGSQLWLTRLVNWGLPVLVNWGLHTKERKETNKKGETMKNYEEKEIDIDTGEYIEEPKTNKTEGYNRAIAWADNFSGSRLRNQKLKEYTALKKIQQAGYSTDEVKRQYIEMYEEDFWRKRGISFHNVLTQLNKKGK